MDWIELTFSTLFGVLRDVLPIVLVVVVFQFLVLRRGLANPARVLTGFVFVVLGIALFLIGLETAIFPLGRGMAEQLIARAIAGGEGWLAYGWIYLFAFAIGFSTTMAEPSLIAVAGKAGEISGGSVGVLGLRIAVALGVATGITLGVYRIVYGLPIHWFIVAAYVVVVMQTAMAPRKMVPLAYDSGGVTTSTVTVPLVAALGLGLAGAVPGRNPLIDGFGLIAFAAPFAIVSVLAYAQLSAFMARKGRTGGPRK
ncbi:MAG: DUF1538 domain-containing protein [Gammaproteobacteria bacterium]|nr:DUF1538 domain-containing protein [Gammaproteobacteria bacterium]MYC58860.1 DUF1538 domain-containing protein [Gammaproteobacteria bacterium]MYH84317.1 DUF1538 domain-containing protein [Gammaproteobacteria bacterium]MYK04315.1 DUF1538 domain-containing protein [Gammaproteobacteria bacterium]